MASRSRHFSRRGNIKLMVTLSTWPTVRWTIPLAHVECGLLVLAWSVGGWSLLPLLLLPLLLLLLPLRLLLPLLLLILRRLRLLILRRLLLPHFGCLFRQCSFPTFFHAIHLLRRQCGFRIRLWGGYWWTRYRDRSGRGTWAKDNMCYDLRGRTRPQGWRCGAVRGRGSGGG